MKQRHRARRLALQGLCCLDVQGAKVTDLVDLFLTDSRESDATIAAARTFIRQTVCAMDEIDAVLARHAHNWDLGRLAVVDRNILRLAVWELRENMAPFKVVLSEAMRLAKEYSTAESPRFVNGILDAIEKELISRDTEDTKNV